MKDVGILEVGVAGVKAVLSTCRRLSPEGTVLGVTTGQERTSM